MRDRERKTDTHTDTHRHTQTHTQTHTHTDTHRHTQTHTDTQTHTQTHTDTHTDMPSLPFYLDLTFCSLLCACNWQALEYAFLFGALGSSTTLDELEHELLDAACASLARADAETLQDTDLESRTMTACLMWIWQLCEKCKLVRPSSALWLIHALPINTQTKNKQTKQDKTRQNKTKQNNRSCYTAFARTSAFRCSLHGDRRTVWTSTT